MRLVVIGLSAYAMLASSILTSVSYANALAGPVVNPTNSHSYYLLEQSNWTDAQEEAVLMGGNLATVNNQVEQDWIFAMFGNFDNVPRDLWIGLNDINEEGNYEWISGEPVDYTNWAPGEPNNSGDEDFVHMFLSDVSPTGQWNDEQNSDLGSRGTGSFGVVEVVPEPASIATLVLGLFMLGTNRKRRLNKVIIQGSLRTAPLLMVAFVLSFNASGQNIDWNNSSSGLFGQSTNWDGGVVPSNADVARFGVTLETTASAVSVQFASNQEVLSAEVVAGQYNWLLGASGPNMTIADTLRIGATPLVNNLLPDESSLVISSTVSDTQLDTIFLRIGNDNSGRTGNLTLDGVTLNSVSGPSLADATLSIIGGAQLLTGSDLSVANLGREAGSSSLVSIDGPDSLWHNLATQFWVGHGGGGGDGTIHITNGGELRSGNALLLGNSSFGGRGQITATGNGTVIIADFTRVFTDSKIEILDGARLEGESSLDIAANLLDDAAVILQGSNSIVSRTTLWMSGFGPSQGGTSLLDIEDGLVQLSQNAFLHPGSTVDLREGSLTLGGADARVKTVSIGSGSQLRGSPIINGSIINDGGRLTPRGSADSSLFEFGTITVSDDLLLNSGFLQIDIGEASDSLLVTGDVQLGGTLQVRLVDEAVLEFGDTFTFIDVGGSLIGEFNGLAEGDIAFTDTLSGLDFRITYQAGDGNDVALFAIPEPASIATLVFGLLILVNHRKRHLERLVILGRSYATPMLFLVCVLAIPNTTTAGSIDFEDGAGHDTLIPANHYEGITFSNAVWISVGGAFGEGNFGLGVDDGLIVGNNWGFPGITSAINLAFTSPATEVLITAFGVGDQGAQIEAFDSGNNSIAIDNAVGIGAGQDNIVMLSVTGAGIARVELTQHLFRGSDDGVGWDNLVVIPEPSSLASLLVALFVSMTTRKRSVTVNSPSKASVPPIALILFLLAIFTPHSVASAQLIGAGSTEGIFTDFVDALGNTEESEPEFQNVRGISTNEIFFQRLISGGAIQPNNFLFEGADFQEVTPGEPFLMGYVTYTNGLWFIGPGSTPLRTYAAPLEISTTPDTGVDEFFSQSLEDTLVLVVTDNSNMTREQAADTIYFENRPDLGSLRVFEEEAATIEVLGVFGSLELHSFGEVVSNPGSGFYFPTLESIPADFTPIETGNGTRPPAPLVPEPATIAMLAVAFVGLMSQRRQQFEREA